MLSIRLKKWKVSSKYLLFSFYLYLQLFADDYNKSTLIKKYGSNNIFKSPRSCWLWDWQGRQATSEALGGGRLERWRLASYQSSTSQQR